MVPTTLFPLRAYALPRVNVEKSIMEKNVGGFDRTWRLVGGALLAIIGVAALVGVVSIGTIVPALLVVLGVVFFATGVLQKCVLNRLVGLDTYRGEEAETDRMDEVSADRPS